MKDDKMSLQEKRSNFPKGSGEKDTVNCITRVNWLADENRLAK